MTARGIRFDLEISSNIEKEKPLPSAQSIQILRIIQEAVQNSVKYSEADEIKVMIDSTGKELLVIVQDDGIGFNESEIKLGNGLYNMRKRAEELEGKLEIQSQSGEGTSVLLLWPNS